MATENSQPVIRNIVHDKRLDTDDVNPLLKQSTSPLPNENGNFIVGKQKKGQLKNIVAGFKLSFTEGLLNPFSNYYEVSRKTYPFSIKFSNLPSAQVTLKFNVDVDFQLSVVDPVPIVADHITSLLDCVRHDLKRAVDQITSRHQVVEVMSAKDELQRRLDHFECPSWLKWTCGLVQIHPDANAAQKLSALAEKPLDIAVIGAKAEVQTVSAIGEKSVRVATEHLEDHAVLRWLQDKHLQGNGAASQAIVDVKQIEVDIQPGRVYEGRIGKVKDFGAYVTIAPGRDAFLDKSQISNEHVERASDKLKEGDHVKVKVLEIHKEGRIDVSMKAVAED